VKINSTVITEPLLRQNNFLFTCVEESSILGVIWKRMLFLKWEESLWPWSGVSINFYMKLVLIPFFSGQCCDKYGKDNTET